MENEEFLAKLGAVLAEITQMDVLRADLSMREHELEQERQSVELRAKMREHDLEQERQSAALRTKIIAEREAKIDAREKSLSQVRNHLSMARTQVKAAEEREAALAKKLTVGALRAELNKFEAVRKAAQLV